MDATASITKLLISTKSMVTALDQNGNPISEYTGTLSDIGPKLKAAFPEMKIDWGNMTSQLPKAAV
jgi:hypothetical protein